MVTKISFQKFVITYLISESKIMQIQLLGGCSVVYLNFMARDFSLASLSHVTLITVGRLGRLFRGEIIRIRYLSSKLLLCSHL